MLPFLASVDLGAIAMKLQHCWNLTSRLLSVLPGLSLWGYYPSTAPPDRAKCFCRDVLPI